MRNTTLLLFLLLLSSTLYAQKLKTFVHPTDGYEIGLPKKWRIKEHNKVSLLVFGPKYNKHYTKDGALIVNVQPVKSEPFNDIYGRYIKQLKLDKSIEELGEQNINGTRYRVYHKTYMYGKVMKTIDYITIKDNNMLVFSFTSMEENFNKLAPLFRQIASTIKY